MANSDYLDEDDKISDRPEPYSTKRTVDLGLCTINSVWANLFFAILAVSGQVGQNVSLPLWIDSTNSGSGKSSTAGDSGKPTVDSYFVLSFASLSFVIIFGLGTLFIRIFRPHLIGETERHFPHRLLVLVGVCDALNGVLVVFSGSGTRTAPYLQAILGNFLIPLTLIARYVSRLAWCFVHKCKMKRQGPTRVTDSPSYYWSFSSVSNRL